MSNNFPKVSPDGRWVVYVRCRNGQLMRPDSQLYIVPFEGGRERRMNCNTPLMNSWHSFSPNGRWLVFSSKSRSPFTQMYLTHLDEKGNDTPPVLIENATAANRAVNIPEFVNIPPDGMLGITPAATDFYRVFDSALELMRKNEIDGAITEWEKAISLNQDEAKAYFNLALCLDRKGRLEDAVAQYRRAAALDPENAAACTNLAVDLARTGKADEAIDVLENCVGSGIGNARAHANLGALLLEKGRGDEAIENCRKAVDLDPDYAEGHNVLGAALAKADRLDEAIPHLEKAVGLMPDSFEYRFNLGRFLAARQRFAEAVPNFEVAVVITRGKELLSLNMLSAVYAEVGKFREAAAAARKALELAVQQNNQELSADLRTRLATYEAKVLR
jgi:tetratricopeptide (TPR) repeat protein